MSEFRLTVQWMRKGSTIRIDIRNCSPVDGITENNEIIRDNYCNNSLFYLIFIYSEKYIVAVITKLEYKVKEIK